MPSPLHLYNRRSRMSYCGANASSNRCRTCCGANTGSRRNYGSANNGSHGRIRQLAMVGDLVAHCWSAIDYWCYRFILVEPKESSQANGEKACPCASASATTTSASATATASSVGFHISAYHDDRCSCSNCSASFDYHLRAATVHTNASHVRATPDELRAAAGIGANADCVCAAAGIANHVCAT